MSEASAENPTSTRAAGGCLCGAVRYQVRGPLRPVVACHCSQCRRSSGHFVAATATRREDLVLTRDEGLRWYRSSSKARRGFCRICGSSLFWERPESATVGIMAGTLDPPTHLKLVRHIFVEDKSDYYALDDGVPCQSGGNHGVAVPEA